MNNLQDFFFALQADLDELDLSRTLALEEKKELSSKLEQSEKEKSTAQTELFSVEAEKDNLANELALVK